MNYNYIDCINITKDEITKMYSISNNIDVKCGLYISFHLIFLTSFFDTNLYKTLLNLEFIHTRGIFVYSIGLILNILYLGCSVWAIARYLDVLKNLSVPTFGDDFFEENKNIQRKRFLQKLLKKYIAFSDATFRVLSEKSTRYNTTINITKVTLISGLASLIFNTLYL